MRAFMLWALLASPSSLRAQSLTSTGTTVAAARTHPTRARANANAKDGLSSSKSSRAGFRVTLRPEPGLKALATKVARILALRGDILVRHGTAPPLDSLDAVPAGDVALARATDASIQLVMGAPDGMSYQARVELSPNGQGDERALALALEALLDRTLLGERAQTLALPLATDPASVAAPDDASRDATEFPPEAALPDDAVLPPPFSGEPAPEGGSLEPVLPVSPLAPAVDPLPLAPVAVAASPQAGAPATSLPAAPLGTSQSLRDGDELLPVSSERPEPKLHVDPMLFISVYGGASSESTALRTGVGMGGGLCVQGQCLRLGVEYPLPISLEAGGGDVRYRYTTFSCAFYSRPLHFGRFTPAASIGLVSRIGHFERDMGIAGSSGLDTDLGLRGTLEGAYAILDSLDVVAEGGIDYALDRWTTGHGEMQLHRGERTSPWLQAAIRIRPH